MQEFYFNVTSNDQTEGIGGHHLHLLPLQPTFLIECNILLAAIQDDLVAADISGMLYEGIDHPAWSMLQIKRFYFRPQRSCNSVSAGFTSAPASGPGKNCPLQHLQYGRTAASLVTLQSVKSHWTEAARSTLPQLLVSLRSITSLAVATMRFCSIPADQPGGHRVF